VSRALIDVIIIGDGVIGLSTAFELGRAGIQCRVFGAVNHGAASGAAAGLLAPSIGTLGPDVQTFFDASLALYPGFVDSLQPFEPELVLLEGLIDVSTEGRRSTGGIPGAANARLLSAGDLALLEPELAARRAVFHPKDGAIDNVVLTRALRAAVGALPSCSLVADDAVVAVRVGSRLQVYTRAGAVVESNTAVVAAGAWSASIDGLPRRLPVAPLKGQMLSVASVGLGHPVMGDDVYIVPRRTEIAIGATAEHAGFDTSVFPEAIERLRRSAAAICPALGDAPVVRTWAGIRPATPDMLPILGADPDHPRLIYACGHSKNGILLAPATAMCIAALATESAPPFDIGPFSVMRFQ